MARVAREGMDSGKADGEKSSPGDNQLHLYQVGRHGPRRRLIHDRARDLWRPVVALAEEIAGHWPDRARRAAVELAGGVRQDNSAPLQLLAHIRFMFAERQTDRLSSETIVQALNGQDDRPWPNRMPPTKVQLARLLAPFAPNAVGGNFVQDTHNRFGYEYCVSGLSHYLGDPSGLVELNVRNGHAGH